MSVEPIASVTTQLASAGTDVLSVATGTRAYLTAQGQEMTPTTPTHELERQQLDIERDGLNLTLYVSYETVDPDTQEATYTGHPANAHPIARIMLDEEPPDWSAVSAWLPEPGNYRRVWMDGLSTTPGRIIWPFDGTWMGKRANHTFSVLRGSKDSPTETLLEIKAVDEGTRPYAYQPGDGTTHLVLDHFSGGSGTQLDPFIIETIEELRAIDDNSGVWGAVFKIVAPGNILDASATAGWNAGAGWKTNCNVSPYFTGQLSGKTVTSGRTQIANLWINRSTADNVGLIRFMGSAVIEYLEITGSVIGQDYFGPFGYSGSSAVTIRYCDNYAAVSGRNFVAGILSCGSFSPISLRLRNFGDVTGSGTTAGVFASGGCAIVNDSENWGDITSNAGAAAGIAGFPGGANRCANFGRVQGVDGVAGIVSRIHPFSANNDNNINVGEVIGTVNVGGIAGYGNGFSVRNSLNVGHVSGNSNVGQIFGQDMNATNCAAAGTVEGTGTTPTNIGAFGGWLNAGRTLTNCHYYDYPGAPPGVGLNEGTGSPTAQATAEYFYTYSNAPMSSWDFITIWDSGPAGVWFPVLKNQGAFIEHLWRPVIVDADGPVAGATVTLVDAQGVTQASYVTNANGLPPTLIYLPETSLVTSPAFAITQHGPYTVTVAATGYTALPAVVPFTADMRGVLYLQAGVLPAVGDVRSGVAVGKLTGTLDLPAVDDVRAGVAFDGESKTGLIDLPAESDVRYGTDFDNETKTGTRSDAPVGKVVAGTAYGAGGTGLTGTYVEVAEADARLATVYGDPASPKTGTLRPYVAPTPIAGPEDPAHAVSLPLENLQLLLADCLSFQTFCGETTPTDALKHIRFFGLDPASPWAASTAVKAGRFVQVSSRPTLLFECTTAGTTHTTAPTWPTTASTAVTDGTAVWTARARAGDASDGSYNSVLRLSRPFAILGQGDDFGLEATGIGEGFDFSASGSIYLMLEAEVPAAYVNAFEDAGLWWSNTLGAILDDMRDLAGQPGYLNVVGFTQRAFGRTELADRQSLGDAWQAIIEVKWSGI